MEILDINLVSLETLNINAVYALINEVDKKAVVFSTVNVLRSLNRLIAENVDHNLDYEMIIQDLAKLKVCILERNVKESELRVRRDVWQNKLKDNGYSLYKEYRTVKYRIQVQNTLINDTLYYCVYLISKRWNKHLVAVFDNLENCNHWIIETYPTDYVTNIVILNNDLYNEIKDVI